MSEAGRQQLRRVLNNALGFIGSKAVAKTITNLSTTKLLDQQVKSIEGSDESSLPGGGVGGERRKPKRPGQIAKVQKIQADVGQLADSIVADPSILDPALKRGEGVQTNLDGIPVKRV